MTEAGSLIRSLSGRPAARNFHTFVINEIGSGIIAGRFPVGTILPNDAAMMDTYGVSRTVLREALKTLEAKGLVEARPKVGTRVSPRSRWNFFDQQVLAWHFEAPFDSGLCASVFDIRLALESRAASLASQRRNAEQVRLMKYWIHQMDVAQDSVESHALAELEVHRIIAEAAANPLLRSMLGVVELTLAWAATAGTDAEKLAMRIASTELHERLIEAIEAGNEKASTDCMAQIIADGMAHALKKLDA